MRNPYIVFWLCSTLVFCLATIEDVDSAGGSGQEGSLHPQAFVTIQEEKADGSLRDSILSRFDIVDRRARIHIRFDQPKMVSALSDKTKLQNRLNDLCGSQELICNKKLMKAKIKQIFLESKGFEISVVARVLPVTGKAFDIGVEGYTSVRDTETDSTKTTRSVVKSIERRPYRYEPKSNNSGCYDAVLSNDIENTVIPLPHDQLVEGDRVEIRVFNHAGGSPRSYTWELEVTDIGLSVRTDPTLLLINRSTVPEGDNELSSDFKPAPGSSVVFGWVTRNRIWNKLDLRLGLNGSFVDFHKDKEFEVGVGLVLSVRGGLLQVVYGCNLHAKEGREYWGLGLEFLNITEKIKELAK